MYLAPRVLPLGFLNSVSLAQHVHRNLALWSGQDDVEGEEVYKPELEIRKDGAPLVGNPNWRVYLGNYDLLERAKPADGSDLQGALAPAVLALRQRYERWEVPRNLKKAVSRSTHAEVRRCKGPRWTASAGWLTQKTPSC